jgi:predicted transglutaminase-like cysteine proteinase
MQNKAKTIITVFFAYAITGAAGAMASESAQAHMTITGHTSQPIGHYAYCQNYRADCNIRSASTNPVKLTRTRWSELNKVNQQVNNTVTPVTDQEFYNTEEYWTYPGKFGDCEDFVLLKRKLLIALGWAPANLLITVVKQSNGDGHAVLTARTDRGDFILDNLEDRIMPWYETGYYFLKRQSARHSGRWEGIDDSRSPFVGSVEQ